MILVIIMVIKIMMMIPDQVLCRLPNMLPHGGHHRRCLDQKNVFRQRLTNLSGKESLTCDSMHIWRNYFFTKCLYNYLDDNNVVNVHPPEQSQAQPASRCPWLSLPGPCSPTPPAIPVGSRSSSCMIIYIFIIIVIIAIIENKPHVQSCPDKEQLASQDRPPPWHQPSSTTW